MITLLMSSALALGLATAGSPLTGSVVAPPPSGATPVAGQKAIRELTQQERLNLIALEQWLRAQEGLRTSETRQACIERLASSAPSKLEQALLDLKCSQRP